METITQLKLREQTISDLNTDLLESQEQLESANKDIGFFRHEKKRLMSANSFQGEVYESTGQQVRAMQAERSELLKQLDASRGQTALANESVDRIQALLDSERKANAAPRQRQELTILQEDLKRANLTIETLKQECMGLQSEIHLLQNTVLVLTKEIVSVQADEQAAVQASVVERREQAAVQVSVAEQQKQSALKDEIRVLENRYRAEVLSSAQATAERNAGPATRENPDSSAGRSYPRLFAGRAQSERDRGTGSANPIVSLGSATRSPLSQTTSPIPQAKSPGSESGFRTIHGQHRADGSLGGYRLDRAMQRTQSDNLYDSSIRNGQSGDRTLSTQTSRSGGPSVTGSDDAQPGQGWRTPPKKKDEAGRTQWG